MPSRSYDPRQFTNRRQEVGTVCQCQCTDGQVHAVVLYWKGGEISTAKLHGRQNRTSIQEHLGTRNDANDRSA
jgi:hypothetical protein